MSRGPSCIIAGGVCDQRRVCCRIQCEYGHAGIDSSIDKRTAKGKRKGSEADTLNTEPGIEEQGESSTILSTGCVRGFCVAPAVPQKAPTVWQRCNTRNQNQKRQTNNFFEKHFIRPQNNTKKTRSLIQTNRPGKGPCVTSLSVVIQDCKSSHFQTMCFKFVRVFVCVRVVCFHILVVCARRKSYNG